MTTATDSRGRVDLVEHGLRASGKVFWNPTTSQLYEHALRRGDGRLAEGGPLAVDTGAHTGRSPKDKFIVRESSSDDRIWWGDVNLPFEESAYERLREKITAHLDGADVYVVDAFA